MLMLATLPAPAAFALPDTVFFPSADGSTEIVAYLFKPETPGPHPAEGSWADSYRFPT